MSSYYNFSRSKFEYELRNICKRNNLSFPIDYTDSYIKFNSSVLERIYLIKSKNPSVFLIIFSSIDLRNDRVREKGSDALRVVMCWKTKKGPLYKHIKKHLRTTGVFSNLEKTLVKTLGDVSNLKPWEFTSEI